MSDEISVSIVETNNIAVEIQQAPAASPGGNVDTVNGVEPDANKNVQLTPGDIGAAASNHNHNGVYQPVMVLDDNYVTDAEKIVIGNTSGTNTGDGVNEVFSFALSDVTSNLSAGTFKKTLNWPFNFVATSVFIGVSTAPTGISIKIDLNDHNGTTIFSTRPEILVNEFTSLTNGTQPALAITTFTKGQKLTADIDQVGSIIAGKELTVYIIGTKS